MAEELAEKLLPISFEPKAILELSDTPSPLTPILVKQYPNARFATKNVDLIIANLKLAWFEDLEAALIKSRTLLNDHGLLLFSFLGPDTLKETAHEWQFPDMHNVGDLLLHLGFKDVVMDKTLYKFTHTYEVFYGCGWKGEPIASQQTAGEFAIPVNKIQRKVS